MTLFRVIQLNVSSVFLALSYSPLMMVYVTWVALIILGLSFWTTFLSMLATCSFLLLLLISMVFLLFDVNSDINKGLMEVTALMRVIQHCFTWFVSSEIGLFASFFYGAFSTSLLVNLEFHSTLYCMPTLYSTILADTGVMFYWFFLDIFNMVMNTFLLFVSGLTMNVFLLLMATRNICIPMFYLLMSLFFGICFAWNQAWEFTLLQMTISTNVFCTHLFVMDSIHFLHVFYGLSSMGLLLFKYLGVHNSDFKNIFLICTVFYWHFVDVVWFMLLRFIYFDTLSIMFLF